MLEHIKKISALSFLLFVWAFFSSAVFSFGSPEDPEKPQPERYSGNALPDDMAALNLAETNAAFIRYVNVLLSNYGEDADKENFHKAIEHHLISQQFYMRREFIEQYREIRKTHKILEPLLEAVIDKNYRQYSLSLLNETNVLVSLSNDPQAASLLKQGYYAYERAHDLYTRAYYTNKFQHGQKIKYYIEAVQQFRLANRFAVRSIIEVKTPIVIKGAYQTQTLGDYISKREVIKETDYDEVRLALITLFKRPMLAQDDAFQLTQRHRDNYGLFYSGKESEYLLYLSQRTSSLEYKEAKAAQE